MAQDDKKRSETLTRAMKSVGAVEIQYAKLVTKMSNKTRLKMYRKIASLMSNRFSLMDALDLLYDGASNGGKSPGEPIAIAIAAWSKSLQNGLTFADALKGWAPARERLMLSTGDVSNLESALLNLIKVTEGTTKMVRPIVGAIVYPGIPDVYVGIDFVWYRCLHGAADAGSRPECALARIGENTG